MAFGEQYKLQKEEGNSSAFYTSPKNSDQQLSWILSNFKLQTKVMKKSRRKFSKEFKLNVVLEALQERSTLSELGEKHELHPHQISSWKQDFLNKAEQIFSSKAPDKAVSEVEAEKAKLYAKIGHLQMEVAFLKKKLFQ